MIDDLPLSDDLSAATLPATPLATVDFRGQLTDAAAVERFMVAGKAKLTVVSQRTGVRFTFRFSRPAPEPYKQRPIWVSLLSGPDNDADYQFIGTMWPGLGWAYRTSPKTRVGHDAPARKALDWFLRCVTQGELRGIEVWHEGCCARCGRTLTVPSSIASGLGPECATRSDMAF